MRRYALSLLWVAACFTDSEPENSTAASSSSSTGGTSTTTTSTSAGPGGSTSSGDPTSGVTSDAGGTGTDTGEASCPQRIDFLFDGGTRADGVDNLVFPVKFSNADFMFYDVARLDGTDVFFFDRDDNPVPFEIDTFRPAGDSVFWVRMPRIDDDNGRVSVCYGSDIDAVSPQSVWADDYVAVWHLNGDPADGDMQLDATGLGHDSTLQPDPGPPPQRVDTPLGTGVQFFQGEFYAANPSANYDLEDAVTVEVIALTAQSPPGFIEPFNGQNVRVRLAADLPNEGPNIEVFFAGGLSSTSRPTVVASVNSWMYVSGVYDSLSGSFEACVDGQQCMPLSVNDNPTIGPIANGETLRFGRFEGTIDEIRVASVARTPQWIQAAQRGLEGSLLTRLD